MKSIVPIVILFLAVVGLCIWDGIHTNSVFEHMEKESSYIHETLIASSIEDEQIQKRIKDLDKYWTKEMDVLSISISRKDLQPVSDYLQYLKSAIINNSQEDAITYSSLLVYNVKGIYESNGIQALNLL